MSGPETGSEFDFVAWGEGEPNDDLTIGWGGNQDYLDFFPKSYGRPSGSWADIWGDPVLYGNQEIGGYIIEYGGLPAT